ncbi:hypothetical protein KUTeg_003954 [Tegillarca granosa]|uniref:PDZ domain-containing protein n=1 Tax=Tegillarca granosa TaxID=220873 RepID=A0ABQ9FNN4_TEGGR|nr:hypothetical protein KUTeg_003954 [Tegillarca granosa]
MNKFGHSTLPAKSKCPGQLRKYGFTIGLHSSGHPNHQTTTGSPSNYVMYWLSLKSRSQELEGPKTYTRIIPSYEYDYTVGSSKDGIHQKLRSDLHKSRRSTMNGENRHGDRERHRDYDWLKSQCEQAMSELQSLKHQQADTVKRYEQALKDSDIFRNNYKTALDQLQQSKNQVDVLKSQIGEMINEKKRLEQEVLNLQALREEDKQELADMRKQQRDVINESGSSEVINKMYDSALDKYEAIKKEYDELREKYADLMLKHDENETKSDFLRDETVKLRKQCESLILERDSANTEKNALKQQCTAAIRNWDQVLHERNELKENLAKVTSQRDEAMKESNLILAAQLQTQKQVEKAIKERDAAVKEYRLVMSERASVHTEFDNLQDSFNETLRKLENTEKEKKGVLDEVETIRHELSAAQQERDKALKEISDIRERCNDMMSKNEELQNQRDIYHKDYEMVTQERDIARKERHEAIKDRDRILRDTYERERTQKEKAEEMDQVSKETESLKRYIDKLKQELNDALMEAENAKKSRDWADEERNKIVQERDSIRTLCDSLRHQRDRAVSDKAQALRDYDELKKQKTQAQKQLKDLGEKYENIVEKEARKKQLNGVGHNHSRDSAIDADLQEWETELQEIEIGGLNPDNLGFELVGGKDDPQMPNDNSIYVGHVTKGSDADGRLKINDIVLQINNMDVTNIDKRTVLQSLKNSHGRVTMLVKRRRCTTPRTWQPLQLNVSLGKDVGICIDQGLFISRINPGSTVAKEGMLITGDRIISVNGKSVEGLSAKELMKMLEDCNDPVQLDVWRQTSFSSSAGSSPTPIIQLPSQCDILPLKQSVWGDTTVTSDSGKSSMKMKSSGSQTDSLDSPGPTPRHKKEKRYSEGSDHKSRHSGHMLDRAREKVEKFLGRHKSQERSESEEYSLSKIDAESPSDYDTENGMEEANFHVPRMENPFTNHQKSSRRKRELEADSNGTWPKCYRGIMPSSENGTVGPQPQRKGYDRASLMPQTFTPLHHPKTPPVPPERTEASIKAVRHSPQSSDGTIKYIHSPQSSDSTIKYSSHSPINSPKTNVKSMNYCQNSNKQNNFSFQQDINLPTSPEMTRRRRPSDNNSRNIRSMNTNHREFPSRDDSDWQMNRSRNRSKQTSERDKRGHNHASYIKPSHTHPPNDLPLIKPTHFEPYNSLPPPRWSGDSSAFDYPPNTHGAWSTPFTSKPFSSSTTSSMSGQRNSIQSTTPTYPISPTFSSPRGSFPDYNDFDNQRHPSYEWWCSSPSPSQRSSTPSDQLFYPYSSHAKGPPPHPEFDPAVSRKPAHDRIHIPSNSAASSTKSGSVEVVPTRGSPGSPLFHDPDTSFDSFNRRREPLDGETRKIIIEKTSAKVGFSIEGGRAGGIFVSGVNENSQAKEAGLVIGDQLLEICGINMRTASKEQAAHILQQCGNNLSLLVQFNPEEYNNSSGGSSDSSPAGSPDPDYKKKSHSSKATRTPSQREVVRSPSQREVARTPSQREVSRTPSQREVARTPSHKEVTRSPSHKEVTRSPSHKEVARSSSHKEVKKSPSQRSSRVNTNVITPDLQCEAPRYVTLKKKSPSTNLGVIIVGGNAVGIFVHEVQPNSIAFGHNGLHCGDRILEYNGVDFNNVTAEQATIELNKPCPSVRMRVQYNPSSKFYLTNGNHQSESVSITIHLVNSVTKKKNQQQKNQETKIISVNDIDNIGYTQISKRPGDAFYIRAHFDRQSENEGDLGFRRNDILFVEDTMYEGKAGHWYACLVDDDGHKLKSGTIPSRDRLEDDITLKRSHSESLSLPDTDDVKGSTRRGSGSARRSFFRRKHGRNNSRDSREFTSFSEASLSSESVPILDDMSMAYTRVERMEYKKIRPVILLAPLADALINKLASESPNKYHSCDLTIMQTSAQVMEQGLSDGSYIDYSFHDDHYVCVRVTTIRETCDQLKKAHEPTFDVNCKQRHYMKFLSI